jgi:hypothetical protein
MYQLEVKTNFRNTRNQLSDSKVHGKTLSGWIMSEKHETIESPNLFYCFVNISKDTSAFKFYIIPSSVVARYVKEEHALWLRVKKREGKKVKETPMRIFRIGTRTEEYPIATPAAELYENNWRFTSRGISKLIRR